MNGNDIKNAFTGGQGLKDFAEKLVKGRELLVVGLLVVAVLLLVAYVSGLLTWNLNGAYNSLVGKNEGVGNNSLYGTSSYGSGWGRFQLGDQIQLGDKMGKGVGYSNSSNLITGNPAIDSIACDDVTGMGSADISRGAYGWVMGNKFQNLKGNEWQKEVHGTDLKVLLQRLESEASGYVINGKVPPQQLTSQIARYKNQLNGSEALTNRSDPESKMSEILHGGN